MSTYWVNITTFLPPVSNTWSLTSCSFRAISFLSAYGFIRLRLIFRGSSSLRSSCMSFFISCFLYSSVSGTSGAFSSASKNFSSFSSPSSRISMRILWKVLLSRILFWSRALAK